jgi:spermidine synthase
MEVVKPRRWIAEQSDGDEMLLFAVKRTIAKARTAIQDAEIVETWNYGKTLLLDGVVQSAEEDEHAYHEALVHPGMIAHPGPKEVLVIGGGEGATLREILRHRSVERVTMVDIDAELVEMCKRHLPEWHEGSFEDSRAEVVIGDGRAFLEGTASTFDVIICDITDFLDHGPAMRLYTREFYQLIASRLNPDGVLIVQALETGIADHEEHAQLVRTIGEAFPVIRSYITFVASFGYTWGFITASNSVDPARLTSAEVDRRIAERLTSELESYDGRTHPGYFALPKDLRALLTAPGDVLDDATVEQWIMDRIAAEALAEAEEEVRATMRG